MHPSLVAVPIMTALRGIRQDSVLLAAGQVVTHLLELLLVVLALGLLVPAVR